MSSPKRLVWLKPQYIGDAVMALPLIDSLGDGVTVRAMPLVLDLLKDRASRIATLPAKKFSGLSSLFAAAKELRALRFDEAILVDRSFRSAMAVRLAGIPVRVGHNTEGRRFLLTHVAEYSPTAPETECGLDLARVIGVEPVVRVPKIELAEAELARGEALRGSATLGIQPGARYASKQYPLEQLVEAVRPFLGQGFVLLGGPDEAEEVARFQAMLPDGAAVDLSGKLSLRESMAVASRLRAVLGSDTGFMHAVAAVGTPTLTLFGPNPASKWAHHEAPHRHLTHPSGAMRDISPGEVSATLWDMRG